MNKSQSFAVLFDKLMLNRMEESTQIIMSSLIIRNDTIIDSYVELDMCQT